MLKHRKREFCEVGFSQNSLFLIPGNISDDIFFRNSPYLVANAPCGDCPVVQQSVKQVPSDAQDFHGLSGREDVRVVVEHGISPLSVSCWFAMCLNRLFRYYRNILFDCGNGVVSRNRTASGGLRCEKMQWEMAGFSGCTGKKGGRMDGSQEIFSGGALHFLRSADCGYSPELVGGWMMASDFYDGWEDEAARDEPGRDRRSRRMAAEVVGLLQAIVNILDIILDNIGRRKE